MSIINHKRSNCLVLLGFTLTAMGSVPAGAQGVNQGLNNEAWQVQRGMNSGMINGAQGAAIDNQIYNVQQQANVDRAMNGGQLTGAERQQIGSEMHAVGQNMRGVASQNGFNPQLMNNSSGGGGGGSMFGGGHQHHHMNLYNQQMNPNQMAAMNQMGGMNAYGRPYGFSGGGGSPMQNGMYGQQGYSQYGQQFGQQYGGGYGQNGMSQGGGLSNAAQMLKKLF
jgi:hypothetical protein